MHAPYGILLWDPATGFFEDANPAAEAILGYSAAELRTMEPRHISKPIQADGRSNLEHGIEQREALLAGRQPTCTWTYVAKDKREVTCRIRLCLLEVDGRQLISNTLIDITEQLSKDEHMRVLTRAIEQSPNGILIRDARKPGGPIVYANEAFLAASGRPSQNVFGQTEFTFRPEDSSSTARYLDAVARGEDFRHTGWFVRDDGQRSYRSVSVAFVRDDEGRPTHTLTVTEDLTGSHDTREKLDILTRAIEQSSQAVVIRDVTESEHRIVYCNDAYAAVAGKPRNEIIGALRTLTLAPRDASRQGELAKREKALASDPIRLRIVRPDGTEAEIEHRRGIVRDAAGNPTHAISFITDVTSKVGAERLAQQQARIIESMDDAALVISNDGTIDFANEGAERLFQYPRDELVGHTTAKLLAGPESYTEKRMRIRAELDRKGSLVFDDVARRKDGSEIDVEVSATALKDERGETIARIFVTRDVSERVRAQEQLRILTRAVDQSDEAIYVRDVRAPGRPIVYCNAAFERLSGKSKLDIFGPGYPMAVSPREQRRLAELRDKMDGNAAFSGIMFALRSDGTEVALEHRRSIIKDESGETTHIMIYCNDVTDTLINDEFMKRAAVILATMADGMVIVDQQGITLDCNETYARILGCTREAMIGQKPAQLGIKSTAFIGQPDGGERFWDKLRADGQVRYEARVTRPDGSQVDCDAVATKLSGFDDAGAEVLHAVVVLRDVTEANRRREILERQAIVMDQMADGVVMFARDGRIMEANRAYCRMLERPREDIIGRNLIELGIGDPQGYDERRARLWAQLDADKVLSVDVLLPQSNGDILICETTAKALCDDKGNVIGSVALVHDVTEMRAKEKELRQAQKMEAVGQLTGGIAHDFNNLLAIIQINLELMRETLPTPPHPASRLIDKAARATRNGAELVKRLLAFSRRQDLSPKPTNADAFIAEMAEFIVRTLPAAISFDHVRKSNLWTCELDQAQFEAAILNLVNNARDAMPNGGKLLLETDNVILTEEYTAHNRGVAPGEYVRIAVSDTGEGISSENLQRVFDPFFTTKDVGAGSGLGLSMIHGFVHQTGGHVSIYSEVGTGTTVSMYFRRQKSGEAEENGDATRAAPHGKSSARILLTEDNDDLREAVEAMLRAMGYDVVSAPTGQDAMAVVEAHDDIALLLTDVMLKGGMNGPELARRAMATRPRLKVVYITGYTANAATQSGLLDPDAVMIQKPFSREALQATLQSVLGHVTARP